MDEVLSSALQSAVCGRLDYLDRLCHEGDEQSKAALANTEITRLTEAWRSLLAAHQPDKRGRCPECSGRRQPRRHPCSVWTIAHQHLLAADSPSATRNLDVPLSPVGRPSRRWKLRDPGHTASPTRGAPQLSERAGRKTVTPL